MEGKMSQGGVAQGGASFGGFDLPGAMPIHRHTQHSHTMNQHQTHACQGSSVRPSNHDGFPLTMGTLQNCDQPMSMPEFNQGDRNKNSASEEDEPSYAEEGVDGHHHEASRGKKGSPWQRVKWTDKMVRLLITAVSYIGDDSTSDVGSGGRRKFPVLQKKGKWKSVSKVMAERGYHVSPQQCEDKFNDLNKRYKRLNDMLGRGTSCQVVENPALLDLIDYLSEKEKDDVRKILSSKQLFYEEMCSYHNGNRLHLPHDLALQRSLQLALRNRDDFENDDIRRSYDDDHDEDDQDIGTDDHDDLEENYASHGESRGIFGGLGTSTKRLKQGESQEGAATFGNSLKSHGPMVQSDANQALPESMRAAWLQKQWIESRSLQLEEQKLQIQAEMLELEKQRLKWQRFSKKKDRELEKMKLENERMKLENERIALELKRKEIGTGFN
ncbi:trihelix transcription factor GT-3a-like [Lotus japonicus]|uniref:trihelix transcription factor GT-3a-like n=1 Tax=Lotus japonicus TaxID=34305 RepID=UPI00258987E8|nr:trihelix transcription factor GT-3a-like [Lotus japonicus]XP_057446090.1 trihelix transcription factor GT-3a-like [Lotus japonicus]XP_057446091.1 trihelix transcription factor GT-3a-like [Lotus japonicus]